MDFNSLLSAVSGQSYVDYSTRLLKKTQEIAATQANELIEALPKPPSLQGVGEKIDLVA